ncbi:hypothetical protein Ae263Ps1_5740 [Pseudonocardia sp. Ae263_Ps1]|nr:hypothetical protein Ae263Ps1_5740 [Pseudonocardia sp. Ae263_Ps1]OLL91294.1 hypothetical protein Ae356Ps1_1191c [Pseudonocardia sp. Ae356_Ps1]
MFDPASSRPPGVRHPRTGGAGHRPDRSRAARPARGIRRRSRGPRAAGPALRARTPGRVVM